MPINLIVGRTDRLEFRPLADWLSASLQPTETKRFHELGTALRKMSAANLIPDLVIVMESEPDEFSSTEVANLIAYSPLARIVVAYGAWCESEGRSRSLWPLAVRVSVHRARARIEREWRLLHEGRGLEPLPLSASREEIFAADHPPLTRTSSPQTVLVVSPDPAYRRYLNELLASAGHAVCPTDAPPSICQPTAILFDADPWSEGQADQLRSLRQLHPTANTIALVSLPYSDHEAVIITMGANSVTPKLGDQALILSAVEQIATTPASQPV